MPNEQKIRQIVRDEILRNQNSSRFGVNSIPNHAHTGTDSSSRIKAEDIIPSTSVTGSITFSSVQEYTIQLNASFTPRNIQAYGVVTGTDGGAVRCLSVGSAQLTPTFYLQPGSSNFVVTGDIQYPFNGKPAQSSAYISMERGSNNDFYALVSEDHIVSIFFNGTIWARATVTGFSKTAITIDVPNLESGWSIIMNYVIS